jgi:hypothetical protein
VADHQAAAVPLEAVVEEVAADVVDAEELKVKTMNNIFYTTLILISFIWLVLMNHSFNPIFERSDFLKFYLILIFGCYASAFALQALKESSSKTTFYFMISIFLLGVVKLMNFIRKTCWVFNHNPCDGNYCSIVC